jgi:arsenite-transporting ATPase
MPLDGLEHNELKLIIFGGKGGVGKTVSAISTAFELSKNHKTLLISTDPAHSISDCLEQEVGFQILKVKGKENLDAIEIDANKALHNWKIEHQSVLKKLFNTSTYLDNQDIEEVLKLSIPGIDEIMSFKIIMDLIEEGHYDKYVVDTAPTGHALRLISSPEMLDNWIKTSVKMRWKYRYMVTRFSGSYKEDEVGAFLLNLKKMVKRTDNMLRDKTKCEFIPVCIPEGMAIKETIGLIDKLALYEIFTRQLVVNNVMVSDDGQFCKRIKISQAPYLKEIKDNFNTLNTVEIPKFSEEIKGLASLDKFKISLFETLINK